MDRCLRGSVARFVLEHRRFFLVPAVLALLGFAVRTPVMRLARFLLQATLRAPQKRTTLVTDAA